MDKKFLIVAVYFLSMINIALMPNLLVGGTCGAVLGAAFGYLVERISHAHYPR